MKLVAQLKQSEVIKEDVTIPNDGLTHGNAVAFLTRRIQAARGQKVADLIKKHWFDEALKRRVPIYGEAADPQGMDEALKKEAAGIDHIIRHIDGGRDLFPALKADREQFTKLINRLKRLQVIDEDTAIPEELTHAELSLRWNTNTIVPTG
jgi:hypothetical protein